ncbi:MAG: hypothetical protein HGA61_01105 [Candidatus Moranbacteria bacterium]|nr:hypothetical protein [Candidatus Moranbacteria bacterium]
MKKIQYLEILKRSFFVSWKDKFLWFFGFFILLGSLAGNINVGKGGLFEKFFYFLGFKQRFFPLLFLLAIVLVVILYVLRILSSAALLRCINNAPLYKQKKKGEILAESLKYFWRLFKMDFLLDFIGFTIFVVLFFPVVLLFSLKAFFFAIVSLFAAILIVIPLLTLIFFLKKFGFIFIVLNDSKLKPSLEFSYGIFSKNIKETLLMGFILFGIFVYTIGFILFLFAVTGLFFLPFVLISYLISAKLLMMVLFFIAGLLALVEFFLVGSVAIVYFKVTWLSFFSEIAMQKIEKESRFVEEVSEIPSPEIA